MPQTHWSWSLVSVDRQYLGRWHFINIMVVLCLVGEGVFVYSPCIFSWQTPTTVDKLWVPTFRIFTTFTTVNKVVTGEILFSISVSTLMIALKPWRRNLSQPGSFWGQQLLFTKHECWLFQIQYCILFTSILVIIRTSQIIKFK